MNCFCMCDYACQLKHRSWTNTPVRMMMMMMMMMMMTTTTTTTTTTTMMMMMMMMTMMIVMTTPPSMRTEFGWPQGCRFQFCGQLACNVSLVQDSQVMWWLCGWGRCTDEHDLHQCQIFPKHTCCLWHCYIFYGHSISECNGQNICNLLLTLFCLKCNASTKQLLITDSFGK